VTPDNSSLPDFITWPTFPFEGVSRLKALDPPVVVEPPRQGEDPETCESCATGDDDYIWVADRWRVRGTGRPSGLPIVLILESRTHLDMGDLPNLLAAELGVMTVRLERAIRSLDGVARVHVNRWGDGSAHLQVWFLARPYGRLQLQGTFLSLWDEALPPIPEETWRTNLGLVAAWLADFGGRAVAAPPRIEWQSPGSLTVGSSASMWGTASDAHADDVFTEDVLAGAEPAGDAWHVQSRGSDIRQSDLGTFELGGAIEWSAHRDVIRSSGLGVLRDPSADDTSAWPVLAPGRGSPSTDDADSNGSSHEGVSDRGPARSTIGPGAIWSTGRSWGLGGSNETADLGIEGALQAGNMPASLSHGGVVEVTAPGAAGDPAAVEAPSSTGKAKSTRARAPRTNAASSETPRTTTPRITTPRAATSRRKSGTAPGSANVVPPDPSAIAEEAVPSARQTGDPGESEGVVD
jgi:hypothetical protein